MDARSTGPTPSPHRPSPNSTNMSAMALEVAKCLQLVAPASMSADDRLGWIAAAVDALEDIRVEEVRAVSAEVRRNVGRAAQIVPEISRLVAERRERSRGAQIVNINPGGAQFHIDREYRERMAKAKTPRDIEDVQAWERQALLNAGLKVREWAEPLTPDELENLTTDIKSMGLAYGFLAYVGGQLVERNPAHG